MFPDDLWLTITFPITGYLQLDRSLGAVARFGIASISAVASVFIFLIVFGIAQVFFQFRVHDFPDET